jgi:hypothetical protein
LYHPVDLLGESSLDLGSSLLGSGKSRVNRKLGIASTLVRSRIPFYELSIDAREFLQSLTYESIYPTIEVSGASI